VTSYGVIIEPNYVTFENVGIRVKPTHLSFGEK